MNFSKLSPEKKQEHNRKSYEKHKERMKSDPVYREKHLKRMRENWHKKEDFYRRNYVNKTKLKEEKVGKELDKLLEKYA